MPATSRCAQIALGSPGQLAAGSASLHSTGAPMPQLAVTSLPAPSLATMPRVDRSVHMNPVGHGPPATGAPVPAAPAPVPATGAAVPATGAPVPATGAPVPAVGALDPATATLPAWGMPPVPATEAPATGAPVPAVVAGGTVAPTPAAGGAAGGVTGLPAAPEGLAPPEPPMMGDTLVTPASPQPIALERATPPNTTHALILIVILLPASPNIENR